MLGFHFTTFSAKEQSFPEEIGIAEVLAMARDFARESRRLIPLYGAARAAILQLLRETGWGRFVPDTKTAVDPLQDARQSCYKTGWALRFVFPGKVLGVQGTGGVEHGQHHHAHIGKNGGPHAGHADRAQHKAGKLDGQCKHDVLVHDA